MRRKDLASILVLQAGRALDAGQIAPIQEHLQKAKQGLAVVVT